MVTLSEPLAAAMLRTGFTTDQVERTVRFFTEAVRCEMVSIIGEDWLNRFAEVSAQTIEEFTG